jgi:alpha-amylase
MSIVPVAPLPGPAGVFAEAACPPARSRRRRSIAARSANLQAQPSTDAQGQGQVAKSSDAIGLQEAEVLERAAAEMAAAATALVAAEHAVAEAARLALEQCGETCPDGVLPADSSHGLESLVWAQASLDGLEKRRTEAALLLERRMAAMEAAIANRRSPKETVESRLAERRKRELLAGFGLRFDGADAVPSSAVHSPVAQAAQEEELSPPSAALGTGPGVGNGSEIVLQGFHWTSHQAKPSWYSVLSSAAEEIAASGVTAIWMPPPTNSVSTEGYLPRDLYDLNSAYGSEAELRATLRRLKEVRVKSVADIVINHRCAHGQKNGKWNQFGGRLAWDESAICRGQPEFGGTGGAHTGEPYPAAPNIDHSNPKVREGLTAWLRYMRSVGFDGWRFDYVKGYDGSYTRHYVDSSVPSLAFGEYWDACSYTGGVLDYNQASLQPSPRPSRLRLSHSRLQDAHRQRTVNWCDKTGGTTAAFGACSLDVLDSGS